VADEEIRHNHLVKPNLERKVFCAIAAWNGAPVLGMLDTDSPVLMDLNFKLPEVDGLDVCHHLRAACQKYI
jgi:DNA-binding response OmpR family regulator